MRSNGRTANQFRPVNILTGQLKHAEGSSIIEIGDTKVLCSATVEENVPPFLRDTGRGWVTAEYSMLPRSTTTRNTRDAVRGRVSGRSQEIQRIIGRALRCIVDFDILGERSVIIDCDVIQADGGTRTASITGAYVALRQAVNWLMENSIINRDPLNDSIAAVSVGIVNGEKVMDLDYKEDSIADVDMNIAMTGSGKLVEIQGTAENIPISKDTLLDLYDLAEKGIKEMTFIQNECFK